MKLTPTILALDLGTKTGWSLYHDGHIFSGMKDLSTKRIEGGGMRYLNFRKWLSSINGSRSIQEVYFEEVNHCGWKNSSSVYGGFMAILTSWCEEHNIPYEGVPVTTIKKFITGKGNAKKEAVIKAIQAKGYDVEDDNEADAMALMLYIKENKS